MLIRTLTGLLLVAVLCAMLFLGFAAQAIVFTVAALIAVKEMHALFKQKGYALFAAPLYGAALLLAAWIYFLPALDPIILLCAMAMLLAAEQVINKQRTFEACMAAMFCLLYPLSLFLLLMQLSVRFGDSTGATALLAAFACPLLGDTLAYFIGTLFGKHKLCPAISPKKTVEGAVASIVGSVLGGALAYFAQPLFGNAQGHLPLLPLLGIGFACGFVGQLGDLFASSLKRWAGIKDYGKLFPGHGGVMDRLDSVLFCAPVVYAGISLCIECIR